MISMQPVIVCNAEESRAEDGLADVTEYSKPPWYREYSNIVFLPSNTKPVSKLITEHNLVHSEKFYINDKDESGGYVICYEPNNVNFDTYPSFNLIRVNGELYLEFIINADFNNSKAYRIQGTMVDAIYDGFTWPYNNDYSKQYFRLPGSGTSFIALDGRRSNGNHYTYGALEVYIPGGYFDTTPPQVDVELDESIWSTPQKGTDLQVVATDDSSIQTIEYKVN